MLERDPEIGWLRIATLPSCEVLIDGRRIGDTPQMSIPLSLGSHAVTLVNTSAGIRETITVLVTGPLPALETRCIDLSARVVPSP